MKSLKDYAQIVNRRLEQIPAVIEDGRFEIGEMPWLLSQSMRYSLSAGGKRLRPCMLLAAVDMLGGGGDEALDFACAVEMIHTYSLIHDDLPGMDNDTLRRGRPTNHVVFGEGQAILAGDGLLSLAMQLLIENAMAHPANYAGEVLAMNEIIRGAGVYGMVGGQCMDLYCEREHVGDEAMLSYIHMNKTARMLISPLRAAAALAGYAPESAETTALTGYGVKFGLLFQAVDDILDVVGDEKTLGKSIGKDAAEGKLTYVTLYGLDGARERADRLAREARESLALFGEKAAFFSGLLDSMAHRVS